MKMSDNNQTFKVEFSETVVVGSGGVKTVNGIAPDENGNVEIDITGSSQNLAPVTKTADMTQPVGVDENGRLWVAPIGGGSGGDTSETTAHGIVWDLVNVSSSNAAVSVADGASLSAVLTAADGYTLGDVTVTMGGAVVTDAWNAETSTIAISSVTGNVVISCVGVEESNGDTTAKIAQTGVRLDNKGGTVVAEQCCITEFYDIPDGYIGKIGIRIARDTSANAPTCLQLYEDDTFKTYWSTDMVEMDSNSQHKSMSIYYESAWPVNKIRFTLFSAEVDSSYVFLVDTGEILFAGVNTPYYGMTNRDGTPAGNTVSVATQVDEAYAMTVLSTGETVTASQYTGLSEEYVTMVQDNYAAMMDEALGDYNKIPIIVHTDQHGRIGVGNPVMKLIGDVTNWYEVSKCINLGDTVTDRFGEIELKNYLSATKNTIPLSKRLEVYGNHDALDADNTQKLSVSQARLSPYFKNIYARRHGNLGYFTVIDDYFNVKYLVVNNMEWPGGVDVKAISAAQAKFIVDELSADDGRDIILVSHIPFDSSNVTSRDSTYITYSEKFLTDTTAHNSFMNMLAARKNHTSGTFVDNNGVEHAYDFTKASGELLMSLHGHAHFEAYRKFENSLAEFIFDMFAGNTFYFGYIDRENMKFKCWKNEIGVEALEINIA